MIDDDVLHRNLVRRTAAGRPDVDEIAAAVAGRVGAVAQPSASRLRIARWRPIAAVAAVAVAAALVVAVVVPAAAPPTAGSTPSASGGVVMELPLSSPLPASDFRQLVEAAATPGSRLVGRIIIVDASFSRLLGNCDSADACLAIAIGDVPAYADQRIRNAPDSSGPFAVRFRSDRAVDLLGPVRLAPGGRLAWGLVPLVDALGQREPSARLSPDVYLVDTSLNRSDTAFPCPTTLPGIEGAFACGIEVSWLGTSTLTDTGGAVSGPADGLRAQNGAFSEFAPESALASGPRAGRYLVRPPVNAPAACFLCPPGGAVEMLGRVDPIDRPTPLPPRSGQPQSGDGWRLLGDAPKGEPYSIRYATDASGLQGMWATLELPGEPPAVDFEREIVVLFGATVSGSCPEIRFDGVGVDRAAGLVYGRFGSGIEAIPPDATLYACTADARPHGFLVAIARDALPPSPFTLRLYRLRTSTECCEGEEVEVDLSR